jgi:ABC-2 type transport system ATP-binding protein
VLDDVSFEVAEGETLAVLGPEGAGKSSLLGVLAGLRVATGGAVRVLGRDPRRDRSELAGEIGMPLPDDELPEDSTVRESLEIEAKARGGGDVGRLLQTSGLGESASVPVADLDPGALRRLSIATARLGDPRVLLLDAPAWELSPVERDEVWRLVRSLGGSGATVVIATTSLEEARALADRAALLVAGEVAFLGGADELTDELFPERTVAFKTVDEPDRPALEELPEVIGVRFEQEADHWSIEARTRQPDELLRLLGADPDFPEIVEVGSQDLYSTFAQPEPRDD